MSTPEDFSLLKSIHNYYEKKNNIIEKNDNILIKYLEDPEILKDKNSNNLSLFINELLEQIKKGNNIILPFIDPCYDLVEAYINSDNDNKEIIFNKIFIQLIENSFINRKNLIPIYAYFTQLYSDVEKMTESDEKINKLSKMINLWNLFYSNSENKNKTTISSFCFLGTGLEIGDIFKFPENIILTIKFNFLNKNFLKFINEDDDIIINEKNNIKYSILSKYKNENNEDISSIKFNFENKNKKIFFVFYINNKEKENGYCKFIDENHKNLKILNNFYGQLKSINISVNKKESKKNEIIYSNKLYPFPLKDNGGIVLSSEIKFNDNNKKKFFKMNISTFLSSYEDVRDNEVNDTLKFLKIKLKTINKNLVKVNYINYKEEFNIIDYFGGLTQFLPFLNIINGIYRNNNIHIINNKEKLDILTDFVKNILLIIAKNITNSGEDKQENFKKYWNFYLYILNKIELFNDKKFKMDINEFLSLKLKKKNEIFLQIFNDFLIYMNNKEKKNEELLKQSITKNYFSLANEKKENKNNNLNSFEKTNNQLYRNIMKQLFVYNRLWSKQHLFFKNVPNCYKNKNEDLKIKYKRINYYTSNFQQPLIYPILEIKNFYPKFKKFDINNLYKNHQENILNYDFSSDYFKNNLNESLVNNYLDNNNTNNKSRLKCCLIKKMYHIKGEIDILEISKNDFKIFFKSTDEENEEKCNKKNKNNKEKEDYNCDLCYGSVFSCLKKDKKRLIFIPKDKIMFIIIRVYYYRTSGLEIFTSDNKSYYFNFFQEFNKNSPNKIFIRLMKEFSFSEINQNDKNKRWFESGLNTDNKLLGWYNPKLSNLLYPLFKEDELINIWNDKKYYYSNFDKLMIINLFSNRSFNDLNQYPVFPMLYYEIGFKRKMNEPIGFQELTEESKDRKQLIIDSYNYSMNEDDNGLAFFNLFYSNITYTCNYLIRVLPYSFIGIEYQGDGFDDPNRLFFSIKSTFLNTLNQRADLRELIPEMFYFPPLFYNINDLNFGKISNGKEIDDVIIQELDENEKRKYKFLNDMRKYLENEENLDLWIDLIFGVNKEQNKKGERYYNKNNNINFDNKENILNDEIIMQSYDFGVLPYQLFDDEFPNKIKISKNLQFEIYKLNNRQFINDHINCLINKKESFICKGEKGINKKYLEIITKIKNENLINLFYSYFINNDDKITIDNLFYLFVGDVFGNLFIYQKTKTKLVKTNHENKYDNEISIDKKIFDKISDEYTLLETLNDHTNEIKYIDYNPRLNLLVDYALDGYINLYTMPTLKLILSIQTKDFDINEIINYVVLLSNPFPMICCITYTKLFVFDINGKLINKLDIDEGISFKFNIDKNCGLFNDYIKNDKDIIFDLFK